MCWGKGPGTAGHDVLRNSSDSCRTFRSHKSRTLRTRARSETVGETRVERAENRLEQSFHLPARPLFRAGPASGFNQLSGEIGIGSRATLLGIAVTEIVTNAFKHAFPTGEGEIELALEVDTTPLIRVVDNGIGIDQEQALASKRYGLGLVRRLVEQVNGELDIRQRETGGTYCEIRLPRLGS